VTGAFCVLEGADGIGKTTQVRRLAERLAASGLEAVTTREPGGTPIGERLRDLLLAGNGPLDPRTEALLLAADRAAHVHAVLRPHLTAGRWVVCDRYVPSSLVYQGVCRALGVDEIDRLNAWATGGLIPDCVVVLDPDDDLLARLPARRDGTDRMEREPDGFHRRVRDAYRHLAGDRGWLLVDAAGNPDDVAARVWDAVRTKLADRLPPAPGRG